MKNIIFFKDNLSDSFEGRIFEFEHKFKDESNLFAEYAIKFDDNYFGCNWESFRDCMSLSVIYPENKLYIVHKCFPFDDLEVCKKYFQVIIEIISPDFSSKPVSYDIVLCADIHMYDIIKSSYEKVKLSCK